jgi:thiosulfate/3-mercaptopyruvate sulfurtransferase
MLKTTITCELLNRKIVTGSPPKGVKILFTTMAGAVAAKPKIVRSQKPKFIPHSIFFDFENDFSDMNSSFSNMMSSIESSQASVRKLGLSLNDEIVVYDDFGNFCASRVWFMLISMGFTNVKTLQGGLPLWLKLGFKTEDALSQVSQLSTAELSPSKHYTFVDADYIMAILSNNKQTTQILDARSYGRYSGVEPEPRANMRSGHIPRSNSMHYSLLLTDGCFKSGDELQSIFNCHDIRLENELITSCGSGVTACILAQAAVTLGASAVSVYDASWSQWGGSDSLPLGTLTYV